MGLKPNKFMTQKETPYEQWVTVLIGIVVLAALGTLFSGNSNTNSPTVSAPSSPTTEHRYVRERFRQEGYSDREAQQAADAIIKFHNAQQNR